MEVNLEAVFWTSYSSFIIGLSFTDGLDIGVMNIALHSSSGQGSRNCQRAFDYLGWLSKIVILKTSIANELIGLKERGLLFIECPHVSDDFQVTRDSKGEPSNA